MTITSDPAPLSDDEFAANQSPPFAGINLFDTDAALRDALSGNGINASEFALSDFGRAWGSAATLNLGQLANEYPPRLRTHDPRGNRFDLVEFHPSYHELMKRSMEAGLHAATWDLAATPLSVRAARVFMAYQVESGHMCPITMTHACVAALKSAPEILGQWLPKITGRAYDPAFRPWWEKSAVTVGMGMTERQGGTDVRRNTTQAVASGEGYLVTGHKWFLSAPMSDAFLVLAQAKGGLSCFLMPRFRPDGARNAIRFQRLKDKLGNRSNASAEVEFHEAFANRIGPEGQGVRTIIEMVQWTRLDCAIASAGLMRLGMARAAHHAKYRRVFGRRLIDQPVMRAVLADMALEIEALTALVFRLVRAFEQAATDPIEAAFARLLTPAVKYLVCKTAPGFLYEAMECLGGDGYVEENLLARAYREAPVNAIWEGSGNVMALDVLRAARHAPETTETIIAALGEATGTTGQMAAAATLEGLLDPHVERHARQLSDRLARLAAMAALGERHPDFSESYAAARFIDEPKATWGASDLGGAERRLLDRILPVGQEDASPGEE